MNSLEIIEWKTRIVEQINSAELPLEVKRLVIIEILHEINNACDLEIQAIKNSKGELLDGTESS